MSNPQLTSFALNVAAAIGGAVLANWTFKKWGARVVWFWLGGFIFAILLTVFE